MEEEKKDSGFVIKDKRCFGESAEEKPPEAAVHAAADEQQERKETSRPASDAGMNYPSVNFTNFVLSLSTSALFHFGDIPEIEGGAAQKNLPAAKQTIDILDMLHEKTKGNLDKDESALIQGVLYELKMRYVKEKA
jgi:hypothetical protein